MPNEIAFDADKFKEAVIYICGKSEADARFGSVKLNKILFYADFRAYTELGASITGATYRHLPEGPAPKEMLPLRAELVRDNALRMEQRTYFNRQQKRPVAQRDADLSAFVDAEIVVLDSTMEFLRDQDAAGSSQISHREWGWRTTKDNEDIPYATAWLSPDELTQEELAFAERLA